jgi:hypothetical protein
MVSAISNSASEIDEMPPRLLRASMVDKEQVVRVLAD